MSKLLPAVSRVTTPPSKPDVQVTQIEFAPCLPAWFGSPGSRVAPSLLPTPVPLNPLIVFLPFMLSVNGNSGGYFSLTRATALLTAPASSLTATL